MRPLAKPYINMAQASILMTIFLGGIFSFYQAGSDLFLCGMEYAGSELHYWLMLSWAQGLLYLAQSLSHKISKLYWILQLLVLPLVLVVLAQLAIAYPRIFIFIACFVVFYWYTIWIINWINNTSFQMPQLGSATAETIVFILLTAIIHSTIAFAIIHTPGLLLGDRKFYLILATSSVIAIWIIRKGPSFDKITINQLPPFGLLIILLLRAKFPDGAYDSLFYKATLPIMIADWHTAITGAIDHTLLGTNFFEIINSQIRILDASYSPAMISSLSFLALWVITPLAMTSLLSKNLGGRSKLAVNTATLLLVSLSEMLIAAGTSYHEPIIGLFVIASLLAHPASWIFLGAAVAGKITVLFICPLIVGFKLLAVYSVPDQVLSTSLNKMSFVSKLKIIINGFDFQHQKKQLPVVIVCLALSAIVVGEQFYRNISYSGRLMGVSESLSNYTDPDNKRLAPPQGATLFDIATQRELLEKAGTTFVHILTLDRWIEPTQFGFHIMPTSRMIAVLAVMIIFVIAFQKIRQNRRLLILCLLWFVCALTLITFFTQGRHIFPLSICAAILVALFVGEVVKKHSESGSRTVGFIFCIVISFAALGDQVVGSFINNAWECRRNIASSVILNNYEQPESDIERRLFDIVKQYRSLPTSNQSNPPTILCEHHIERMPYLGAHYIYANATYELNLRHLAANPDNTRLLPTSFLAICFTDPEFPNQLLPQEIRDEFVEVLSEGEINILVSKPLMSGAKSTSLVGPQMNILGWLSPRAPLVDLLKVWELGESSSDLIADTPNGKGIFIAEIDAQEIGFLISPYSVTFNRIPFIEHSKLEIELGLYYSNSDGMIVELVLENDNGIKQSEQLNIHPSSANPEWEKIIIPISSSIIGTGKITISAKSDGGTSTADWAVFRKFILTIK